MSTGDEIYPPTERTRVRRRKQRAAYDKATVHAILDEAFLAHVGFVVDGQPFVIPTLYARDGETLYMHGSGANRMLKTLEQGVDACATITLMDGFVLARSAFHHSLNYRSVVALGKARAVTNADEILRALQLITDHVVPQRWKEVRPPNDVELKQTLVLAMPLTEVSAKVRSGPAIDDEDDYAIPVWAGVVPLTMQVASPIADARISPDAPPLNATRFMSRAR
jgi:uncharacterized protein